MNYLIYISTATRLFNDNDLKTLLLQSRTNNAKSGITGVLLYSNGTFFQVLEGEDGQLGHSFNKIKNDPRHKGIIKMKTGLLAERNFPEWSMGFTTSIPDSLAQLPGFVNPAKRDFIPAYQSAHPAFSLLRSFTATNNLAYY